MIPIYMTSFFRKDFTENSVKFINERTRPGTYQLTIYDNGSDKDTRDFLYKLLDEGKITALILDSRNTGCLYNKIVFHAMTETSCKYYCITDNDIYPPKLSPDWLEQMTTLMDKHPELGLLSPQLPPQWLQMPLNSTDDLVYCKAVGNTFKFIRRDLLKIDGIEQALGRFGDDGQISDLIEKAGYKVAFAKNIFCFHAGQCDNWGYTKDQIDKDPRKAGYGAPFSYTVVNEDTYEPESRWKM